MRTFSILARLHVASRSLLGCFASRGLVVAWVALVAACGANFTTKTYPLRPLWSSHVDRPSVPMFLVARSRDGWTEVMDRASIPRGDGRHAYVRVDRRKVIDWHTESIVVVSGLSSSGEVPPLQLTRAGDRIFVTIEPTYLAPALGVVTRWTIVAKVPRGAVADRVPVFLEGMPLAASWLP
jgi:hypothetical protein